jgi:hypothetical protein
VQVELKIGDEAPQADASWDFRPIESVTHCVTLSWQAKISERRLWGGICSGTEWFGSPAFGGCRD